MKKEPIRCWGLTEADTLMVHYHDTEWGVPVHDDRHLFEKIVLDGAQAGLSWSTILNKRENYRKAFDNFDVKKVERYTPKKIERLMQDKGIVRNRLKINSAVKNARAFIEIQKEFGSFDAYISTVSVDDVVPVVHIHIMLRMALRWVLFCCCMSAAGGSLADPSRLSVALSTNTWRMGTMPVGGVADTWYASPGHFAISNNGSVSADIYISVTNSSPSGWEPSAKHGPGLFSCQYAVDACGGAPVYVPLTLVGTEVSTRLGTNEVLRFDLRIEVPVDAIPDTDEEIRLDVMAIESEG